MGAVALHLMPAGMALSGFGTSRNTPNVPLELLRKFEESLLKDAGKHAPRGS